MTIAISLKVNDGLVLAADSASTLIRQDPATGEAEVINVYYNANKVFNLHKGLPIGATTWGAGNIGNASISTLIKDFRDRLSGEKSPATEGWAINKDSYTIEEVAHKLRKFIFDELYQKEFANWPKKPSLGFVVAGYSAGADMAEEFQIDINNGACHGPYLVRPLKDSGVTWSGEPEAVSRIVLGFSPQLVEVMQTRLSVPQDQIGSVMDILRESLAVPLVMPAMPFQDAIDLAEFLVDITVKYSRFKPGVTSVGGPIEVAAISKHEGFKWIRRKHYFSPDLNPDTVLLGRSEDR